jgi:hypothetical protein
MPSLPLTTVTVMVEPLFLALTRTPSSGSCPAVTLPSSAVATCAAACPAAASQATAMAQQTLATMERRDMTVSSNFDYYCLPEAV